MLCTVLPSILNTDNFVVSTSIDVSSSWKGDTAFYGSTFDYSCADCDGVRDYLRDVLWKNTFNLGASAAASQFCVYIHGGNDAYIPYPSLKMSGESYFWSYFEAIFEAISPRSYFCA